MLNVTTRNWFFRWAYLFKSDRDYITTTTVCELFWRSIIVTPFQIAVMAVPVIALSLAVAKEGWLRVFGTIIVALVLALGLVVLMSWIAERQYHRSLDAKPRNRFLREAYRGIKERYCPIVRVSR